MSEIMALRGRLAVSEKTAHTLSIGIDTDIDELRMLADKFEIKTELKTDRLAHVAARIHDQVMRLRQVNDFIASIKKELGE